MWKIKKVKRAGVQASRHKVAAPPDYTVPRFVARQMVQILRVAHLACDELERMFPLLPDDHKALYAHLINLNIRPSSFDLMKLIDLSEQRGLLSPDEASTIRAGRSIDNPLPEDDGDHANIQAQTS